MKAQNHRWAHHALLFLSGAFWKREPGAPDWAWDLEAGCRVLRACCSGEEEEETRADSAPFVPYDYFKTPADQSDGPSLQMAETQTQVLGGERIPRC